VNVQVNGVACGGSCSTSAGQVTANLGTVAGGGAKTLTFAATVPASTTGSAATSAISVTFSGGPTGSSPVSDTKSLLLSPGAPTITSTDPPSGADDNNPKVIGTLGSGTPTGVKIYTNASCSGSPAATGTPAQFTGAGIAISVPDNSTTALSAAASNASGDSGCSNTINHVESTQAPPPPGDTQAPETTIARGPKKNSRERTARFEFASSEPASRFECELDTGGFDGCASPAKFKVKPGRHTLMVRAVDAAGNADQTPATFHWKVKPKRRQ
jgi:hypothetical protein